jgi:hypothetical protein
MFAMNRVKFLNFLQLKIIEEHYHVSSCFEPDDFHKAFMTFVKKGGPQILRKALDYHECRIKYYLEQGHDYSHEELCQISKELEEYEEIRQL